MYHLRFKKCFMIIFRGMVKNTRTRSIGVTSRSGAVTLHISPKILFIYKMQIDNHMYSLSLLWGLNERIYKTATIKLQHDIERKEDAHNQWLFLLFLQTYIIFCHVKKSWITSTKSYLNLANKFGTEMNKIGKGLIEWVMNIHEDH